VPADAGATDVGAVLVTAGVAVVAAADAVVVAVGTVFAGAAGTVAEVMGVLLAVAGVLEADIEDVDVIGVTLPAGTKVFGAAVLARASRIA
jgi:hypothetical protein